MSILLKSQDIDKNYGISCLENYYIIFLKSLGFQIGKIYAESLVELSCIQSFISNNINYLEYEKLPRVFLTGQKLNIINRTEFDIVTNFMEISNYCGNNCITCLNIDYTRLPITNSLVPWSNNHYVLVKTISADSNNICVINDTPVSEFFMTFEQMEECGLGKGVRFEFTNKLDNETLFRMVNKTISKIFTIDSFECESVVEELNESNITHFRDAIGILKISRNRMLSFLQWYNEDMGSIDDDMIENLNSQTKMLTELFMTIELFRLRKKIDVRKLHLSLQKIHEQEKIWRKWW